MSRVHFTTTAASAAMAAACPALVTLSSPAYAQLPDTPQNHSRPLAQILSNNGTLSRKQAQTALRVQFEKHGANHDGVISSSEFVEPRFTMFDAADADGDGQLTLSEMRAYALSIMRAHQGEPTMPDQ